MKLTNPEIRIETTNKCNSHCIMCPREKMKRKQGIMDIILFKDILDEVKDYGITNVFLGGYGEPLTDPMIVDRIEYVKKFDFYVNFISNGCLLNEKKAEELIYAGLNEIRFSLYGLTRDVYEGIHRGLSFDTTKRNILNLINLRHKLNRDNPKIYVFFLILNNNSHEVEMFKEEWEGIADAIEIWRPHNFGDGKMFRHVNGNKVSCGRPKMGPIQIQLDGTVIPCCWDYDGRMILGDLKKDSLEDILHNEKYRAIRDAHQKKEFEKFPFCNNCDQLNEKSDALVYSTRHNLPPEEAIKLTNSSLFNLKS